MSYSLVCTRVSCHRSLLSRDRPHIKPPPRLCRRGSRRQTAFACVSEVWVLLLRPRDGQRARLHPTE